MAKRRKSSTKRIVNKAVRKAARRHPFAFLAAALLLVAVVGVGSLLYFHYGKDKDKHEHPDSSSSITYGDSSTISFHFIEQNVPNSGDVVYIKAGENDILIDGGAKESVAKTIQTYLSDKVSDGKLEYVIATHAHLDHIAGLIGNNDSSEPGGKNGVLYHYEIGTIIDFSYFDSGSYAHLNRWEGNELSEARTNGKVGDKYAQYIAARDYAISKGATHKLAKELTQEGNNYKVELGENLSMEILYNFFYDHTSAELSSLNPSFKKSKFSSQNDCSVSLQFIQAGKRFLFTGDAEEYAEYSLVKSNNLGKVSLFKAGHHGSYTASSDTLLDVIKPDTIVCCACAGNQEYAKNSLHSFPAQEAIERFAKHTDEVYVTTLGSWSDGNYHAPFNGNVVVSYDLKGNRKLSFSNSDLKLKDTAWFKNNRNCPLSWKG